MKKVNNSLSRLKKGIRTIKVIKTLDKLMKINKPGPLPSNQKVGSFNGYLISV